VNELRGVCVNGDALFTHNMQSSQRRINGEKARALIQQLCKLIFCKNSQLNTCIELVAARTRGDEA
jgi:hypothetical protein